MKPTVGRIVHYRENPNYDNAPLAAIVVKVLSARLVNLCVFDAFGVPSSKTGVPLRMGEVPTGAYWEWPVKTD